MYIRNERVFTSSILVTYSVHVVLIVYIMKPKVKLMEKKKIEKLVLAISNNITFMWETHSILYHNYSSYPG